MYDRLAVPPNQSLSDGLACLQLLAAVAVEEPTGCCELVRRLGLEPIGINRLFKTLATLGLGAYLPEIEFP